MVLANGLNIGLRRNLGIERQIVSPCHSISIGFDLCARRPRRFRISGANVFLGAAERAYPLSDAVSGRHEDAG